MKTNRGWRLLLGHRRALRALARRVVDPAASRARLSEAHAVAVPLVRAAVEAKFPPADMAVCLRYGLGHAHDDCIKLKELDGDMVRQFDFAPGTGPAVARRTTSGVVYAVGGAAMRAVLDWERAREDHGEERRRRVEDYDALIAGCATFEELAVLWPEARSIEAELFPAVAAQVPSPLTEELLDRLRNDMAERSR